MWLAKAVILAFFVLLALIYAGQTPFFEAPDEAAHFLYAHNLLETDDLPTMFESRRDVFASQATHRHHPPLYYLAGAALIATTSRDDIDAYLVQNPLGAIGTVQADNLNAYLHNWRDPGGDTSTAIWLMRGFSILLSAATIWLIGRIGEAVTGDAWVGLLAMLLAASIPTFLFIGASINNDNLVTFFYTAGLLWLVERWRAKAIAWRDVALISVILAGMALTKINGLSLFGLIYGGLLIGMMRGRFQRRDVIRAIGVSLAATAMLAGWWYVRNVDLYGDPLAVDAAGAIWGRGDDAPVNLPSEAWSVWISFWAVLGQFNIRAPEIVYFGVNALTLVGMAGLWRRWRQDKTQRPMTLILAATIALTILSLLVATLRVNISQGRLLFPALGAFVVLMAWGLTHWRRWIGFALVLPLTAFAIAAPFTLLRPAYQTLTVVEAAPDDVGFVDLNAESMRLLRYRPSVEVAQPGDTLHIDVWFSGSHGDDLALSIKAIDPVTGHIYGGIDGYPGMTFTSQLDPDAIYRETVAFSLRDQPEAPQPPRQLSFEFNWLVIGSTFETATPTVTVERALRWADRDGGLVVPGVVLIDDRYEAPEIDSLLSADFAGGIRLDGTSLSAGPYQPGETIDIAFIWDAWETINDDWTLTVQLLDSAGELVTQSDGDVPGYPTSQWQVGRAFDDTRRLQIPDDTAASSYVLVAGWYTETERMPVVVGESLNSLLVISDRVMIE